MPAFNRTTKIKLGNTYRDSISGFEGVATGRFEYLYGCVRICLEGQVKDGKEQALIFDEQRLVDVKTQKLVEPTAKSGGPMDAPAGRTAPTR